MRQFWKGVLVGAIMVGTGVFLVAAAEDDSAGRYKGLDREGPVIIVDTRTGDFVIQSGGGVQGHRWEDAWTTD